MIFLCSFLRLSLAQDILIQNARLIDSRGDLGVHSLLVSAQKIAAINPDKLPEDIRIIDGASLSVLPGLIDAHVHISQIPGSVYREESLAEKKQRQAWYMRAYLSLGVTTIVDPGISVEDARIVRELQEHTPSPDVLFIGPLIGPKDGYPSNVLPELPGIENIEDVTEKISQFSELDPLGIKITLEEGVLQKHLPLFSTVLQQEIATLAEENEYDLYIHAMTTSTTQQALDMKPHALVHAPLTPNKRLARRIAAENVFVCSTLSISHASLEIWDSVQLPNPQLERSILPDEYEAYFSEEFRAQFAQKGWETVAPDWPSWLGRLLFRESVFRYQAKQARRMLSTLHEEGVPLVLGSDTPGWPLIPYLMHGPSTHFEIDLLHAAGLSAQEIITAATATPAKMLGKEEEMGSLHIGNTADLLIVEGNPLEDISALHRPVWVMKSGELRRAEEWMSSALD